MTHRIALVTSHPVQYQVPWIRRLAAVPGIDLTVFYAMQPDARQQGIEYGVPFEWDQPVLDGYRFRVMHNVARDPSPLRLSGCDTPEIGAIIRDQDWQVVVVHGWYLKTCLQALWACRRHGVPCLIRGESSSLQPRKWHKRVFHRILLSQYAGALAIGKRNREFYLDNKVPPERIFHTPYGVDNERFRRQADELLLRRDELRKQFDLPVDSIVFLFCARFVEKKRPFDFLRALERASAGLRGSTVFGLMIGDGALKPDCERYAADKQLPVRFGGFLNQDNIARAYVAADCLALPSDSGETWGLVVNEAMACGRPAIVSDQVGCAIDLIEPGATGASYPCGEVDQLAELMLRYATDPSGLETMGRKARHHVEAYAPEHVVEGVLDAVRYVLQLNVPNRIETART